MAYKWTTEEEQVRKKELEFLYIQKNLTIKQIAQLLRIAESSVYVRLLRLEIPTNRASKTGYNNQNNRVRIPQCMSEELAEFIGILLGDGHLTYMQICVTLGNKEQAYADYVSALMEKLFGDKPRIFINKNSCATVYIGSSAAVKWLFKNFGLVYNKVKSQVDVPKQCFQKPEYMKRTLRGLMDTDGSVYLIRHGIQMSFTNKSTNLLHSCRRLMIRLGFHPSQVSCNKVYLSQASDIIKYYKEIGFSNPRHLIRLNNFQQIFGRFV